MKPKAHRFLLSLISALALIWMPLALPPAVQAQAAKSYFTFFESGLRATTTSSNLNLSDVQATGFVAFLNVTAQAGTNPTLDVVIQDAISSAGPWFTLITFSQITASTASVVGQAARAPARWVRAVGTVGGSSTPTFTYSLKAFTFYAPGIAITNTDSGIGAFTTWSVTEAANGAGARIVVNSEEVTLNTGATTTDSTANLLPANSLILTVTGNVTVTITTAASWGLGDPTTAARFTATNAGAVAANSKLVGIDMWSGAVTTLAAGPSQAAAAKVRITTNANPGAGKVRVTVIALQFNAPTS
jgi:hypothetical protein